jgi:hypothetical protein
MNCHPQCRHENRYRQGVHNKYRDVLVEMYGKEAVENLEKRARLGGKLDCYMLQQMIV